jgi:hypothetical protein
MTPSGSNPATFQVVAQCLDHCATACPGVSVGSDKHLSEEIKTLYLVVSSFVV